MRILATLYIDMLTEVLVFKFLEEMMEGYTVILMHKLEVMMVKELNNKM